MASAVTKAADRRHCGGTRPALRSAPHRGVIDTGATTLPPAPTALPERSTVSATTSDRSDRASATITLERRRQPTPSSWCPRTTIRAGRQPWTGPLAPTYRADFNLIGVPLPAGARKVELTFHDAAVDKGKMITLVALVLAFAAMAAAPWRIGGALPERALVIVPTYNERENIERLIDRVLAQDDSYRAC